jgi:hypothetical protein
VRCTGWRLLVPDSTVPIRRRRVITADASLGFRLAGICPYLPAPVRVPGWRGTQSRVSGDGSGLLRWDVEGVRRYGRPCGADTSDVVSVNQIGKREEPTTHVCDEHIRYD